MVTDSLVGTWDLINYDMKPVGGGEVVHPLGSNAIGRLTYAADGSMSAFIAAADRPAIGWRGESIEAEAAAYESFNAYAGTYSIDGGRVVHHVSISSVPAWTGSDQVRGFYFEDANLVLTVTVPVRGEQMFNRLVWRRR